MQTRNNISLKKKLIIDKKLIYTLIIIFLNLFLVLNNIPLCSDTGHYLSHPGFEFSINSADSFLYSYLFLIKNNIVWFKSLQIISVLFFNFSLYLLPLNSQRLFIGSLIPWLFSILGIHFWSCGIRNAIGFSSLLVAYAFKKTDKFSNHKKIKILAIILFLIIAILCHWSIFLLFPFVIFPEIISTFLKLTKNTLLIKTKIPKNIFFIISIVVIFSILYIFSQGNSKIFTTYVLFARREAYGTIFPYVMILNLFLFFITSKKCLASSPTIQTFFILILLSSIMPILGFNPLIIRFQLQFWVIFLITLLIYQKNLKKLIFYLLISSPPFIYYLIENYPKYYFY